MKKLIFAICLLMMVPGCGGTKIIRGTNAFNAGNYELSERYFVEALSYSTLQKKRDVAYYYLGASQLNRGKYFEAIDSFNQALMLSDKDWLIKSTKDYLFCAYWNQHDYKNALNYTGYPVLGVRLADKKSTDRPATIEHVNPGPAKKAGIFRGDVITSVNGQPVTLATVENQLKLATMSFPKSIRLGIERHGLSQFIDVDFFPTLDEQEIRNLIHSGRSSSTL